MSSTVSCSSAVDVGSIHKQVICPTRGTRFAKIIIKSPSDIGCIGQSGKILRKTGKENICSSPVCCIEECFIVDIQRWQNSPAQITGTENE